MGNEQVSPVAEAGRKFLLAKADFSHEWLGYWNTVEPCDDDTGWTMLEKFRRQVHSFVVDMGRKEKGVANAAREMFRLVAVGEATYTAEDCYRFVKWYEQLRNRIGMAISRLIRTRSDDGLIDFKDSLPLAGEGVAKRCLATSPSPSSSHRGFDSEHEIEQAVYRAVGDFKDFICRGENYVLKNLRKAAVADFLLEVRRDRGWARDNEAALRLADMLEM